VAVTVAVKIERGIWMTGEDVAQIAFLCTRYLKEEYKVVKVGAM
jgi:hypothetical protein